MDIMRWQDINKITKPVILDTENYGSPPRNSGIRINETCFSVYEPQAWSDDLWNWFYNFSAALQLEKILWRNLPTIQELLSAMNNNPDNFRQNAGYRIGNDGEFFERGDFSTFWSSTRGIFGWVYCSYLKASSDIAYSSLSFRHRWLSLRFILEEK